MKLLANKVSADFERWLAQDHPLFGDPKQFFRAYNSGMLSTTYDDVKLIATCLEDAYRNVSVMNGSIMIQPEDFVLTRELIEDLEQLQLWIEIREAAVEAVQSLDSGASLFLEEKKLKKFSTITEDGAVVPVDTVVLPKYTQSYVHALPETLFTEVSAPDDGRPLFRVDVEALKEHDTSVVYRLAQVTHS